MTREEEIRRGQEAERLLNNDLFVESFAKVRQGLIDAWTKSSIADIDGQRDLRISLACLDRVHKLIADVAMTGKLAMMQEDKQE